MLTNKYLHIRLLKGASFFFMRATPPKSVTLRGERAYRRVHATHPARINTPHPRKREAAAAHKAASRANPALNQAQAWRARAPQRPRPSRPREARTKHAGRRRPRARASRWWWRARQPSWSWQRSAVAKARRRRTARAAARPQQQQQPRQQPVCANAARRRPHAAWTPSRAWSPYASPHPPRGRRAGAHWLRV